MQQDEHTSPPPNPLPEYWEGEKTWHSLKNLIADALEKSAAERDAFLIETCNGDAAMLEEARALIEAYEQSDGVIDGRTDAWLGLGGPDLLALGGQRVGRYQLEKLLAEGAMAAVYVARQNNPQRRVALKLLRATLPMVDASLRFQRESQALGRLKHPNIARIYEAGVHRAGPSSAKSPAAAMPFIAMELVEGPPITTFARDNKISREARVRLMIKVALAVHAAHQQAVIHRDIKPGNVLVDESSGEPKVLDFGIARIIGVDEENYTWQTTAGVLLGTPGYMAPEQAAGRLGEVDVRSDVWALGVMLYELLTDQLPIEVKHTSIAEALRRIETQEPQLIGKIDSSLRGDLETIVSTALAREKTRRYPSAQAFADDLRRVLEYEPITARRASRWYRTRMFVRRHRVGVAMTALSLVLLISGAIVASIGFVNASRQRDLAVAAEARANAVNQFLKEMLYSADTSAGGTHDLTVLAAIRGAVGKIEKTFGSDPLAEAGVRESIGYTLFTLGQYDDAQPQLERAVELYRQRRGDRDRVTLDATNYLLMNLRWQYRGEEAMRLAEQTLKLSTEALGESDPTTLSIMDNTAGAAHDLGQYERAEAQFRKLMDLASKSDKLGPEAEITLTAMNNLSLVLSDSGKNDEAEKLLRKVIELRRKAQGDTSLGQITSRSNLAVILVATGRAVEAEAALRQLLADAERVLGPGHDHTIATMSALARAIGRQGRYEEGLNLQRQIMERSIAEHGGDFPQSVRASGNYAAALLEMNRPEDAIPIIEQAAAATLATYGENHLEGIRCQNMLAKAYIQVGRLDEGEKLLLSTLERSRKMGPEPYDFLVANVHFAALRVEQKRPSEAIEILVPLLDAAKRTREPRMEAMMRRTLGLAYQQQGDFSRAEHELKNSFQIFQTAKQDESDLKRAATLLAQLYSATNRHEEAAEWQEIASGKQ